MRIIYVNGQEIRREFGCGFRPLKKCPLVAYAETNGYDAKCDRTRLATPRIKIDSVQDIKKVCDDIQVICDNCKFSTCHFIKQRSK